MSHAEFLNKTILIVDDHPINVDGYQALLSSLESNKESEFFLAYDCKHAFDKINKIQLLNRKIDLALIDINLPTYKEKKLFSGIDIAVLIRRVFPTCKIIIISMHKEPLWVNQVIKSVSPEGFLAKSDVNYKIFPEIIQIIEKDEIYISPTIKQSQKIMLQNNIRWDDYDSKILQLISQGVKTIDLINYIPLSLSTIEKRKANIKKQLILKTGSDKELIDVAKNLGII